MLVEPGRTIALDLNGVAGWLVVDTFIMGRCWGGIRVSSSVTVSEIELLARAMTLKCALAGIPIGGAKIGIKTEPSDIKSLNLVEKLANNISNLVKERRYIPGTDMGFSEENLRQLYIHTGVQSAHTLHRSCGSLSLTGLAVAESLHASIDEAIKLYDLHECETVALQGFGNMGSAAAHVLSERSYRIVAVANRFHTLVDKKGINVYSLLELKNKFGEECLREYHRSSFGSEIHAAEYFLDADADIHVPGAGVLNVVKKPNCKILAPISNYPVSVKFSHQLEKRGVRVIPDIIANAGGAIGSALTVLRRSFEEDRHAIAFLTRKNLKKIVHEASREGITPIEQSYSVAWAKLMKLRKLGPLGLPEYMKPLVEVVGSDILSVFQSFRNR